MSATVYAGDENHVRSLRYLADHDRVPAAMREAARARLRELGHLDAAVPAWLDQVLEAAAVLDLHSPDARRELARKLIAAAGGESAKASALMIAETIASSAAVVLRQKIASTALGQSVLIDTEYSRHVAREIGNNASQTVLFALALGPDEEE